MRQGHALASLCIATTCALATHGVAAQAKPSEPSTLRAHATLAKTLPFTDRQDFEDAMRGFVGTVPDATVRTADGRRSVWHMKPCDFLGSDRPADTVNPSLWRQAQLDAIHGLFRVGERIYQVRGLDLAITHTMHNLYTLRGAELRDGNLWSKYIDEARVAYGERTDILIAQHHWPVAGNARVVSLMRQQRDMYKFIHDQSLRLLDRGHTADEIAGTLRMPASLDHVWSARGYYGTLRYNAKAVHQKYLGWYDANPANLDPLPPVESARKTVAYMGGADAVHADPSNRAARELGADALEQLGYQAEAGTWRNAYLVGTMELRDGVPKNPAAGGANGDMLKAVGNDLFFDFPGVRLDAAKAEGKHLVINWVFTDSGDQVVLTLENPALTHVAGRQADADATVRVSRAVLDAITLEQTGVQAALLAGDLAIEGDRGKLAELMGMLDSFQPTFPVVEPRVPVGNR
ncbi:MAG TPA: alkyl sulfatase dimerization domain-containing protein [Variovorax sp.]|nr:alkyl sulfatase dimerization domain-containing protein [Variovorax sp.]